NLSSGNHSSLCELVTFEQTNDMTSSPPFIVITGITKGIGLAIAERFANEGFGLIGCSRSQPDLDELTRRMRSLHPDILIHLMPTDLGVPKEVKKFGTFVLQHAP